MTIISEKEYIIRKLAEHKDDNYSLVPLVEELEIEYAVLKEFNPSLLIKSSTEMNDLAQLAIL